MTQKIVWRVSRLSNSKIDYLHSINFDGCVSSLNIPLVTLLHRHRAFSLNNPLGNSPFISVSEKWTFIGMPFKILRRSPTYKNKQEIERRFYLLENFYLFKLRMPIFSSTAFYKRYTVEKKCCIRAMIFWNR